MDIFPGTASSFYCQKIVERLKKYNSKIQYQHFNYKDAGHGIIANYNGAIYHPVGKFWCRLGGTPEGNKFATQDSFSKLINFLKKHL